MRSIVAYPAVLVEFQGLLSPAHVGRGPGDKLKKHKDQAVTASSMNKRRASWVDYSASASRQALNPHSGDGAMPDMRLIIPDADIYGCAVSTIGVAITLVGMMMGGESAKVLIRSLMNRKLTRF